MKSRIRYRREELLAVSRARVIAGEGMGPLVPIEGMRSRMLEQQSVCSDRQVVEPLIVVGKLLSLA